MDRVLAWWFSIGLFSAAAAVSNSCVASCPAGSHKVGDCTNETIRCERCKNNTFIDKENKLPSCMRCRTCEHFQVAIKPCTLTSNTECDCQDEYFDANYENKDRSPQNCLKCESQNCANWHTNPDFKRKCNPCQGSICCQTPLLSTNLSATSRSDRAATTTTTLSTTTTTGTKASSTTGNPSINPMQPPSVSLLFVAVFLAFLLLFLLLLTFIRILTRYPDGPRWCTNKNLQSSIEDAIFNEQRSHQRSSPTTLTLSISEQIPMMSLSHSPPPPENPSPISPLLPDAEHKAAAQDEQLEHWPAIVLYAIIKEVPLRRWKEFLRLLSVADQQLERVELEAGLGQSSMERQYQMLRLWSQQSAACLDDVFSALHYMDLSGCAQLLQESLEKLQWRPEAKRGPADGVMMT